MSGVAIVPYAPHHAASFRDLNLPWISRNFAVEPTDREQLDEPDARILARGGAVLIAEEGGRVVGCVGLLPHAPGELELIKMAVSDDSQGKGVGAMLMIAAIDRAREMGAATLYLETNASLGPAIRLYERTGFRHLATNDRPATPYARCNVFMRMIL